MDMEVCRLCLDLLHDNNFSQLDEPSKVVIKMVAPEVNFEISSNPVICKQCSTSSNELHKFKIKIIENEQHIKQKYNGESCDQLSLKEILYGVNLGEIVVTEKAKERICRTCLDSIDGESFTVLKPSKPDAYLDSMITMCLPELDLELSRDPVMCEKCLRYLQKLHHLKTSCLDIEEKIKNYCTNHGTNSSAQINLHSVLETSVDKKDHLEYVAIKAEIKSEKLDDDDDVEMNDEQINTEKDTMQDVKEEMEIKTEEESPLSIIRTELAQINFILKEANLDRGFPLSLKVLLAYNGYDNIVSLSMLDEDKVVKIEKFTREVLSQSLNPEEKMLLFGCYVDDIAIFTMLPSHRKLLSILRDWCKMIMAKQSPKSTPKKIYNIRI